MRARWLSPPRADDGGHADRGPAGAPGTLERTVPNRVRLGVGRMSTGDAAPAKQETAAKLTLLTLTALVVGSMVGAGVFNLPSRFARETGVAGALVAWAIAGIGMLMLAFV